MKRNVEATVKFQIFHSKDRDAMLSECEKVERDVEQTFEIEIPEEVVGLINNLYFAGKLDFIITVSGSCFVNLKDAVVRNDRIVRRNSEVGHTTSIHHKESWWKFWHWI